MAGRVAAVPPKLLRLNTADAQKAVCGSGVDLKRDPRMIQSWVLCLVSLSGMTRAGAWVLGPPEGGDGMGVVPRRAVVQQPG